MSQPKQKNKLTFSNVSFGYSVGNVISEASGEISPGSITAVVGKNGSGKTTLMKILCAMLKPAKGKVEYGGRNISDFSEKELGLVFSTVFNSDFIVQPFTVYDFVLLGRYPVSKGLYFSKEDRDAAGDAISFTGIENLASKRLNEISSGELQLAMIASALCRNSDIVILDEPVSHLDITHSLKIFGILRALRDSGKTVITSIHDINLALDFCDNLIAMRNGTVFFNGEKNKFYKNSYPEKVFATKFVEGTNPVTKKPHLFPINGE